MDKIVTKIVKIFKKSDWLFRGLRTKKHDNFTENQKPEMVYLFDYFSIPDLTSSKTIKLLNGLNFSTTLLSKPFCNKEDAEDVKSQLKVT